MAKRSCRAFVITLIAVISLPWIFARETSACTCISAELKSVGQTYRDASAVVIGRVERVEHVAKGKPLPEDFVATILPTEFEGAVAILTIVEAFKGIESSSLVVGSGKGCFAFPFVVGESYLFYAYRSTNDSLPIVSTCGRSRRTALSTADLDFLRGLPATLEQSGFSGTVSWSDATATANQTLPLPDVRVTLEGPAVALETLTDARGVYRFAAVVPGDYKLRVHLPDHLTAFIPGLQAADGTSWFVRDVEARLNGRIRGRLLGPNGKPLAEVKVGVDLVDAARPVDRIDLEGESYTGPDGAFVLEGLSTGRYVLVVNPSGRADSDSPFPRTFFPGVTARADATAIAVEAGRETAVRDFDLPQAFEQVVIRGVVVDKTGKPWPKAWVRVAEVVSERGQESWPDLQQTWLGVMEADGEGRFSFTVLAGKPYEVDAALHIPGSEDQLTNRVTVKARAKMPAVRLVAPVARKSG